MKTRLAPLSFTRRTSICCVGILPETKSIHGHLGFSGGGRLFVFVFLEGAEAGILRWLLETRLRFARAAAKGQRLEGSSGVMRRSGL